MDVVVNVLVFLGFASCGLMFGVIVGAQLEVRANRRRRKLWCEFYRVWLKEWSLIAADIEAAGGSLDGWMQAKLQEQQIGVDCYCVDGRWS